MPTSYKDQFFEVDPGNPPPRGTALNFVRLELIDTDDNGLIEPNVGDTLNGLEVTAVYEGDTLRVRVPGVGQIWYTGTTFYLSDGTEFFTPTDGQVLQNGTYRNSTGVTTSTNMPVGDLGPTCFTPGTLIDTPLGPRPVEDLRVGDLVTTLDDGDQILRLILLEDHRAEGRNAPIRFETGAIENDAPLLVSPEHRVLLQGWRAELTLGCAEVLVAAKHLVNDTTIRRVTGGRVRYIHLVFDAHQIVFGQGVPSESCLPTRALCSNPGTSRSALQAHYALLGSDMSDVLVRPAARRIEAEVLIAA